MIARHRNPENMPRGVCRCGGPTVATLISHHPRVIRMLCDRCQKESRECDCTPVVPVHCEECGAQIGVRAPEEGITYVPSLKYGHVCKKT